MRSNTTIKVALQTGAAKDDTFTFGEDVMTTSLNVLANDPGAARLVSVGTPTGTGQLVPMMSTTTARGATISINPDGTIAYDASAVSGMLQALGTGEFLEDSFSYTVRMSNGALSTATVKVVLQGVNDAPTLTAVSTLSGGTEDVFREITYAELAEAADEADVDGDALSFRIESVTSGTLQKWNAVSSAWEAVVDGSTVIAGGDKLQWKGAQDANGTLDAFTVKAFDGDLVSAAAVQVKVQVAAVNDAAVISSNAAGTVVEDGQLTAGGKLTVVDPDAGEAGFRAVSGNPVSSYGTFSFNADSGVWGYTLDNAASNVQALSAGETVTDTLMVTSLDGTASGLITVTIIGAAESNAVTSYTVNSGQATGNKSPLVISNFDSNDLLNLVGQVKFTGVSMIDHIPNDGLIPDSTRVHVADNNGNGFVILVGYTSFDQASQII